MPTLSIPVTRIRSTAEGLAILAAQLEPSMLAYRVGGILDVIQPDADRLARALEALVDRHVLIEALPGGGVKRCTVETDTGREWLMRDRATYFAEEDALLEGDREFVLPWLLTEAHILAIPRSLLPVPPGGRRIPINFAAIRRVMVADETACATCRGSGVSAADVHKDAPPPAAIAGAPV